jgi:hypothetical protein
MVPSGRSTPARLRAADRRMSGEQRRVIATRRGRPPPAVGRWRILVPVALSTISIARCVAVEAARRIDDCPDRFLASSTIS